jgi:hypothetical protein
MQKLKGLGLDQGFHLASISTSVNKRIFMKNMSIERVIFGSFEFPLFGTLKVHKSLVEADFCSFLTEGC